MPCYAILVFIISYSWFDKFSSNPDILYAIECNQSYQVIQNMLWYNGTFKFILTEKLKPNGNCSKHTKL